MSVAQDRSGDSSLDTILVTGGCGFLGSHVVEAFAEDPKNRVVAISRNPTRFLNSRVSYLKCDITDHSKVAALIDDVKPRIIVHTVSPGPFEPRKVQHRDYLATKNLVEIAVKSPHVQALVYTGSAEAVANASGLRSEGLTETESVLHSLESGPTPYARTKSAADTLVRNASTGNAQKNKQNGNYANQLRTAVIRVPAMYGPRDNHGTPKILGAANTLVTRIQFGDDRPLLDWVYVESCANAHYLAAKALIGPPRSDDMRVDGEAFNVNDGNPMKFWEYSRKMWTLAGDNCERKKIISIPWWLIIAMVTVTELAYFVLTFGQKMPPMSRHHIAYMKAGAMFDTEKAKTRLGYTPLVDTEEGMRRSVSWFQQQSKSKSPAGRAAVADQSAKPQT